MVKWLKDCFSGMISVLFVLNVIGFAVGGTIFGVTSGSMMMLFVGIFGGLLVGLVVGVATFGFLATIVNIAENQEEILRILSGGELPNDKDEDEDEDEE